MRKFQVNEYLSLRLEEEDTIIYVGGELFRQCKFLLLTIEIDEIQSLADIESIDEASERLDKSQEYSDLKVVGIPPEIEFWGHCSNLQVWYENDYDTRLLHSSLAFPLLKRLNEVGDLLARKVFKEEIAKRFSASIPRVMFYLLEEKYLNFLNHEEIDLLLSSVKEKDPQIFSFFLPTLIMYKYISQNDTRDKIKAFTEKFELETDIGAFQNMGLDEHLLWLRLKHITKLEIMLRKYNRLN